MSNCRSHEVSVTAASGSCSAIPNVHEDRVDVTGLLSQRSDVAGVGDIATISSAASMIA